MSSSLDEPIYAFEAHHRDWKGDVCLYDDGKMARPGIDQGRYEFEKHHRLLLKWDHWSPEELMWCEERQIYQNLQKTFSLRPVPVDAIRWNFANFWSGFDALAFERHLLGVSGKHKFRISEQNPQIVFESVFGTPGKGRERWPKARQVWYTGENVAPPLDQFDKCLSFHRDIKDPRHLRWPYYLLHLASLPMSFNDLVKCQSSVSTWAERPGFCAFIAFNEGCQTRNRFVEKLSRYRRVDCPGRVLNNMTSETLGQRGNLHGKINFLKQYKYAVCFENTSTRGSEGYVTEKLVDAMLAGCIPLYWGDHRVGEDFNENSFINLGVYGNDVNAMVQHVIELDSDERLQNNLFQEPWLPEIKSSEHFSFETSKDAILKLVANVNK